MGTGAPGSEKGRRAIRTSTDRLIASLIVGGVTVGGDATFALAATATGQVIAAEPHVGADVAVAGSVWPIAVAASASLLLFLIIRGWRLPPDRGTPSLPPTVLLALAAAMVLAAPVGVAIALTFDSSPDPPDALRSQGITMLGAYSAQMAVFLVWLALRRAEPTPMRPRWWRELGTGVVTVALAWPIVAAVFAIVAHLRLRMVGEETARLAHETLQALDAGGGPWAIVVILLAAVSAPLVEEVLFRGLLQPFARSVGAGPWTAIALVSVLFAAVHWTAVPPPGIAALFVLGLGFGWARERTGGLVAPITAHALFNIGNLALAAA